MKLADVYERPDDDDLRRVLADELIEKGDPRGELIQLQLVDAPTEKQAKRIRELLGKYGKEWLGRLADVIYPTRVVFRRGFLAECRTRKTKIDHSRRPEWATVERIVFHRDAGRAPVALLSSDVVRSLRSVENIGGDTLVSLLRRERPLPFASIEAHEDGRLDDAARAEIGRAEALPELRRFAWSPSTLDSMDWLWESPLAARVETIEICEFAEAASRFLGLATRTKRPIAHARFASWRDLHDWVLTFRADRVEVARRFGRGPDDEVDRARALADRLAGLPRDLAIHVELERDDALAAALASFRRVSFGRPDPSTRRTSARTPGR